MFDTTGYILAMVFVGAGGVTTKDLRNYAMATGGEIPVSTWTAVASIAGLISMIWFVAGFFLEPWWAPLLGLALGVVWSISEPRSLRHSRKYPAYATGLCAFGFLGIALYSLGALRG